MPLSQAREKASKCQLEGQLRAEPPIWASVLNEPSASQIRGRTISIAQTARNPWEKTFSTMPSEALLAPSLGRPLPTDRSAEGSPGALITVVILVSRSELDALAAGGAQRDDGEDHGQDEHDHAHGAGVAALAEVEEVAHQHRGHDLAVVVGTAAELAGSHGRHQHEH